LYDGAIQAVPRLKPSSWNFQVEPGVISVVGLPGAGIVESTTTVNVVVGIALFSESLIFVVPLRVTS
jgi:hypothetical protein